MRKITSHAQLKDEIALLEVENSIHALVLRVELKEMYESLRPVNLIKSTFRELAASPSFKGELLNTAMGIGAGYLSKKVVVGSTHNPLKQLLGTLLEVGIASAVSKNAEGIKSGVMNLFSHLFAKEKS